MAIAAKSSPLVSIMLLCYNHEEFVAEAVRGVLFQTYTPLEIIIFDDCSPDATADIIERTLREQPPHANVRFIRNPKNMTANTVVRTALRMARGELLFVSHGDDIMMPQMVEEMVEFWLREKVSLVVANAFYIDENSQPLNRTWRDIDVSPDDSFEDLASRGFNACCFGPAIGFERAVSEKFGWVPRYLRAYDIMYPFYAYLLNGARFMTKPLLYYRVHGRNTSLSLAIEKADPREKAAIEERMCLGQLAHAVLMEEVLDRLVGEEPQRYEPIARQILPLLNTQMADWGKRLIRVSRAEGLLASGLPRDDISVCESGRRNETDVPTSSDVNISEFYEAHARACDPKDFQSQVLRNPNGQPVGEDQLAMITAAISDNLDVTVSDVLLDLCCGNGAITDPIFARCQGGVGVDFTPYLIEVAVKHFQTVPSRVYRLSDIEDYVSISEDVLRFTKVLFYGAFQTLAEDKARNVLRTLRHRFLNVTRVFIGNLPDLDRAPRFFRDISSDCPTLDHLKRYDTPIGVWRTGREFEQLAADCGWRCQFSRMPAAFYAVHYRFDATLTPDE